MQFLITATFVLIYSNILGKAFFKCYLFQLKHMAGNNKRNVKCLKETLIEMHEVRFPCQKDLSNYHKLLLSHMGENESVIRWYIAKIEENEAILEYVSSLELNITNLNV